MWKEEHHKRVVECSFFVCLMTLETLTSTAVQNEILWALESECTIITICHHNYRFGIQFPEERANEQVIEKELIEKLGSRQAIFIEKDGVAEYADKISEISRAYHKQRLTLLPFASLRLCVESLDLDFNL